MKKHGKPHGKHMENTWKAHGNHMENVSLRTATGPFAPRSGSLDLCEASFVADIFTMLHLAQAGAQGFTLAACAAKSPSQRDAFGVCRCWVSLGLRCPHVLESQ